MKMMRMIGIMSGTSLDGVDMICVDFNFQNKDIDWTILASHCYDYNEEWKNSLANAHHLSAGELLALDARYGQFLGERVNHFITQNQLKKIDGIASHGHTIFHQPDKEFTLQIGHGAHIQAITGHTVVSDFRSQDVALGGQGAPLVPIGDKLLFSEFDACVNLGGFANISFDDSNQRIAFDICPVNFVINYLCQQIGKDFDDKGEIAKNSDVDRNLVEKLNAIPFYHHQPPKSLGREWVESNIYHLLENSSISVQDKIATFSHHAAFQIAEILNKNLFPILYKKENLIR